MKNKKKDIRWTLMFHLFVTGPLASMMAGYGIFWVYMQRFHNVWLSMFVGCYFAILLYEFALRKIDFEGESK